VEALTPCPVSIGIYVLPTKSDGQIERLCSPRPRPACGTLVAQPASDLGHSARPSVARAEPAERDTQIRRLALVKASAEYCAARPELGPHDVLAIAQVWEQWVVEC
jgi:hypothetical protein